MKSRQTVIAGLLFVVIMVFSLGAYAACNVGDKAQVLWKGSWYPAQVLKVNGDQCFIHYDNYGSNWDEWVGPDRIKIAGGAAPSPAAPALSVGDPLQVNWKGAWYPARVIAVGKDRQVKIHYDGYDNSWDEWVGPSRYKK